ncbi:hypothetical protein BTS2_2406 [Bacillus sp. TS-2]|nr:hypothetical protein BTS2_2406 [Bacillus sp. TS-2]
MKISYIKLTNFRGIKETIKIKLNELNVIVGKNDAGKSTILKALNLFLNDVTFNKDDLNLNADDPCVTIEIGFSISQHLDVLKYNDEDLVLTEEILTSNSELVIKKTWDTSRTRINSDFYVLRAKYEEYDFLLLNDKELNKLCKELDITNELEMREKRIELSKILSEKNISHTFEFEKLTTSGTSKSKKIYDTIRKMLPSFEYFAADSSLSESDTAIQNYFKKMAIEIIDNEIDREETEKPIIENLERIFKKITEKINSVVGYEESVKGEIKFDWTKLVQTSFKSENNEGSIPLSSRGDGFRRVTMMSYFEFLAEQRLEEKQNIIFGFEEPETFLHPSAQESLFNKLKAMGENDYQVILTTHSPIIVANSTSDEMIHVYKDNGDYVVKTQLSDVLQIADDLGIRIENQLINKVDKAKVLFLVEGIDDVSAFNHLCGLYKRERLIEHTFEELGVVILPVGGCDSIKHWVTLNLLRELEKPYFIYLDSDKKTLEEESTNEIKLTAFGFNKGSDFLVSKKRELENYIPVSALNRLVEGSNLDYGDWDDVKLITRKHNLSGRLGGKKVVERHFGKLTFDDVRQTFFDGTGDEFIEIYELVKGKLKVSSSSLSY